MAISKTDFINYSRCDRYVALDEIKKEKLDADITYEEYQKEERQNKLLELKEEMYSENENGDEESLIDVSDPQLEAMLKYYAKTEAVAASVALKRFGGKVTCSTDTFSQECFDYSLNGIKYMCYVDIYNEVDDHINIIEVKATTSRKYAKETFGERGKDKFPFFIKKDNIYYLAEDIDNNFANEKIEKSYFNKRESLFDRYTSLGKYVYDLAIQRYIIEGEHKNSHNESKLDNIDYYLAVLNHEYIYDGESDYETDCNGEEIVSFIKLTTITKEYQELIDKNRRIIEERIKKSDASPCPLGCYCEKGKPSKCKFFKQVCGSKIPKYNSSISYMNNGFGFKDELGNNHVGLELINEGYLDLLDIPESWIKNNNHIIQRNCYETKKPYINKEKIMAVLDCIEYPIYHLDFETFPCPLPRFRGERCYEQSPFEFSLHIEKKPGECDFNKDNYVFLAHSLNDEREDLVKMLVELIDGDKGTLFAQNVSFEQRCIKRLSEIFPEYKEKLMKMYNRGFDLIYVLRNKSDLFLELGYNPVEAQTVNYYDYRFSGSYSIKKTLPVFSDLTYDSLDVKNGVEALKEYSTFGSITKEELDLKRKWLIDYCKQDTWAMVLILNKVIEIVNQM